MKIFEPTRHKYNKDRYSKSEDGIFKDCPFCNRKSFQAQVCKSFSFKHWLVVANKFPYMNGNLMLVSKRHFEELEEMTREEGAEWHEAVIEVKKVLRALFATQSFNISINIGEFSGQSVRHIHWQIVPRHRHQVNSVNIFADMFVISVSAPMLVRMVDEHNAKQKKQR